jgi:tetratricopeptide (TPR) repeat protein
MPRRQFLIYLLSFAAMLVYYVWMLRRHLRKRRLRRQLVDQGRLQSPRSRAETRVWLKTLALAAAGFPLFWACERLVKPVAGTLGAMAAFMGAIFVIAFTVMYFKSRGTSDSVVSEALRLGKQGQVDQAVRILRDAIAASPTPSPSRVGAVGLVLAVAGRWTEAAEAYREARRMDPGQPIFTVNLALALTKTDRAAEALTIAEEARKAAPQEAAFAAAEAMALAALGRAEEAAEQLRQAKEIIEVAPGEQRVDVWTTGNLLVECGKAVDAASPRGFPVVPTAAAAATTEAGGNA